jgi:uroporphyrin-III C-methyltransferase
MQDYDLCDPFFRNSSPAVNATIGTLAFEILEAANSMTGRWHTRRRFMSQGKVYLVGAGPGDPNLLTLEAFHLLKKADVVFHDDLVSPEVLALIPSETHVESVGKRIGHSRITQQQIHSLLINAAREGWTVVRLKSGDPLIFGRAGEELEAMGSAGIECVIVPGITAGCAAAARSGIPLTDRRLASRLVFLSNHQCAGKPLFDWRGALSKDATVLIYMPGADYQALSARLCAEGLAADTPCLLMSHATTPKQRTHRTTVGGLRHAPRCSAPVVLVVGAVARYAATGNPGRARGMAGEESLPAACEFPLTGDPNESPFTTAETAPGPGFS